MNKKLAKYQKLHFMTVFLVWILGSSCEQEYQRFIQPFFAGQTEIDPCDPAANFYDGRTHYIERDMIRDDGTLDYDRVIRASDPAESDCDPLRNESKPE